MRSSWRTIALGASLALFASNAAAEDEFDVTANGRQVTVTPKGHWHINVAYPWKLVVQVAPDQSVALPKSSFQIDEKRATVSSKTGGTALLKGAVCIQTAEQNECRQFQKSLKLP